LLLFDAGRLVADGPRDKVLSLLQPKPPSPEPVASPRVVQTAPIVQKSNVN
jgi:ATP-binding cassette, subfamily C, bacterial LapB